MKLLAWYHIFSSAYFVLQCPYKLRDKIFGGSVDTISTPYRPARCYHSTENYGKFSTKPRDNVMESRLVLLGYLTLQHYRNLFKFADEERPLFSGSTPLQYRKNPPVFVIFPATPPNFKSKYKLASWGVIQPKS